MKFSGWFSIIVGILMLVQWSFFLAAGQVPEVHTAPLALAFHLAAEAVTALALIASGAGLLRGSRAARPAAYMALGLLIYTVIVSPGYFAQQGDWPLVGMFAALLLGALYSLYRLSRGE